MTQWLLQGAPARIELQPEVDAVFPVEEPGAAPTLPADSLETATGEDCERNYDFDRDQDAVDEVLSCVQNGWLQ